MPIPKDYLERVYAGVLGKTIGVYLGRPFEGWSYERIQAELGDISYYVNDRLNAPLVVVDDDISGTFTFIRALPDNNNSRNLTANAIGLTWLNYIIENKTTLWWGGFGNSTEHTAYIRLKSGVMAPSSGSAAVNGRIVAEQIGAQIFIDAWALVAPGDPKLAAELAGKAASVSHDGEAVYAAQLLAAMEAQAFVESNIECLLDTGLSFIPKHSIIYRLITDVRTWCARDGDWRATRKRIAEKYGYEKFPGNCHIVPNHAVVILSLLYSEDDFGTALTIANTSGWDTDCNSGNVGCLMGIKNGLPGLERGADFRGPVADRLLISSADGGRAITDAVSETYRLVQIGRALREEAPIPLPKNGARFHFDLPGSVQGFEVEPAQAHPPLATIKNVAGHSRAGLRSLALRFWELTPGQVVRVSTCTFVPPDYGIPSQYQLAASPTLFSGQKVRLRVQADAANRGDVRVLPYIVYYGDDDAFTNLYGPAQLLVPAQDAELEWMIEDLRGSPIARFGVELKADAPAEGQVFLDYVDWRGAPATKFRQPDRGGIMWRRAWVNAMDQVSVRYPPSFHLSQGRGTGLFIQGSRDWSDYLVQTGIRAVIARSLGLAVRVQGLLRYYALRLGPGPKVQLIKCSGSVEILQEADFTWLADATYELKLAVTGPSIKAYLAGTEIFDFTDERNPFLSGGVGFLCEEGAITSEAIDVQGF